LWVFGCQSLVLRFQGGKPPTPANDKSGRRPTIDTLRGDLPLFPGGLAIFAVLLLFIMLQQELSVFVGFEASIQATLWAMLMELCQYGLHRQVERDNCVQNLLQCPPLSRSDLQATVDELLYTGRQAAPGRVYVFEHAHGGRSTVASSLRCGKHSVIAETRKRVMEVCVRVVAASPRGAVA
tara:strand:+ start:220 stop:762 length:543 start_codon:yes stop_codon:yes gene_type:complete